MKTNNFVKGMMSLLFSQVMIKLFGVIYTLYLTNKKGFGDSGNAIFLSGYQIYSLMLTMSSIGIPNAISRLIAERKYKGDILNEKKIFKVSIIILGSIGMFLSIILFFLSKYIGYNILQIPETVLELKILSPAIFFVSITSVYKGYFNGENKISLTAKCLCYEQIVKTVITIFCVEVIGKITYYNTEFMATYASFSTTCACIFGFLYCLIKYKKIDVNNKQENLFKVERIKTILKKVLIITLPISLTAIINSFGKNIDSITIVRILKKSMSAGDALKRYGIISSKVDILTTFPLSINMAIVTALMPELIKNKIRKSNIELLENIKKAISITMLFGIAYSFGIYFYSKNIFDLLFPKALDGIELLKLSSFNIIFALLVQTYNGIIQGIGDNKIPLCACSIGLILKIFFNILLISIEGIDEKGAIISNILSNFVSFIILEIYIRKKLKIKLNIIKYFFRGIFIGSNIIFISKIILKYLNNFFNSNLSFFITGVISAFLYVFMIFFGKKCKKSKTLKPL